ncbi:MAG: helix-turn-helix transcriptional regulator [Halobacteriovoraceae bacterium]|jgi:transcriptional regulator with XRE-family HTH domain|nr:helix-turn-helix transcriptional regulator [Halobacteriovoraceae bacterium]MBT5095280.1 helix-turn-helix transcriptional regulator [Halobacteriovoraceae bacterium]
MTTYQNEIYPLLAKKLKFELKRENIHQSAVGKALGIKQSAVSSLLNGKSNMTLQQFLTLCELVHLLPEVFFKEVKACLLSQHPTTQVKN